MAKNDDKLTLSGLTQSLKAGKMSMSPAIAAQLEAATAAMAKEEQPAAAPAPKEQVQLKRSMDGLILSVNKLVKAIEENTKLWTSRSKPSAQSVNASDLSENQLEAQRVQDYQTSLLEKIEENTRGMGEKQKEEQKPEEDKSSSLGKLALFGTLLAVSLGAIVGVLVAQAKVMVGTLKLLSKLIPPKLIEAVTNAVKRIPQIINDMITKVMINIEYAFNLVTDLFKNRFPKTFGAIEDAITGFKNFFVNVFEKAKKVVSVIGDVVTTTFNFLKDGFIKYFAQPISEGMKLIREGSSSVVKGVEGVGSFVTGIKDFFGGIGKWLKSFVKVFKGAMVIAEKIAMPITIIMGLFDGITEAIEGYKKGGILGGIQGFITGVLNSVVGGFLDLIKDIVSWILDKLGLDSVSNFLDSFSFSDMIKSFIDALFHPIDTLKGILTSITKFLAGIEIPGFSVFGKKFGPWKPFSGIMGGAESKEDQAAASAGNKAVPQTKSIEKPEATGKTPYGPTGTRALTKQEERMMSDAAFDAEFGPVDGAPKISQSPSSANKVYNQSSQNEAAKQVPVTQPKATVIAAPTQVNNQTQNSIFRTKVRNDDNTVNSYLKSRFAI